MTTFLVRAREKENEKVSAQSGLDYTMEEDIKRRCKKSRFLDTTRYSPGPMTVAIEGVRVVCKIIFVIQLFGSFQNGFKLSW